MQAYWKIPSVISTPPIRLGKKKNTKSILWRSNFVAYIVWYIPYRFKYDGKWKARISCLNSILRFSHIHLRTECLHLLNLIILRHFCNSNELQSMIFDRFELHIIKHQKYAWIKTFTKIRFQSLIFSPWTFYSFNQLSTVAIAPWSRGKKFIRHVFVIKGKQVPTFEISNGRH